MPRVKLFSMAVLLMIAGCAGPMGPVRSSSTAASVNAYDGSYQVSIGVTAMAAEAKGTNWCDTPGQPVLTVANGQFNYSLEHPNVPGNMTTSFAATMAQDGSFSGQSMDGSIKGQVSGSHIDGSINGQGCVYAFSGDRM